MTGVLTLCTPYSKVVDYFMVAYIVYVHTFYYNESYHTKSPGIFKLRSYYKFNGLKIRHIV